MHATFCIAIRADGKGNGSLLEEQLARSTRLAIATHLMGAVRVGSSYDPLGTWVELQSV